MHTRMHARTPRALHNLTNGFFKQHITQVSAALCIQVLYTYIVTGETGKSGGFSAGSGMRKGWFSRDQLSIVSNAMFGTDSLAIFRAKMGLEGISPLQLDTQEPCATTAGLR